MDINPRQKEFFNERAEVWDKISVHDLEKVDLIASLLNLKGDEDILDVGTGTGVMIPFYLKYIDSGSITALDYSENMIAVARRKYPERSSPHLSYRVADLYTIKEKETYDTIVCYSCFPHFPEKSSAIKIFSEALRNNGTLMISHSCSRDKINQVHQDGGEVICHDYLPDMDQLREMFRESGLTVTDTRDDKEFHYIIGKKIDYDVNVSNHKG